MKKPNIVFFFTDDQRFDTIAALGNENIKTPNIDRLVERGTAFTHAHIPCGTSGAVCMPSRAMLHTGRSLFHIEKEGQSIPEEHTTMGELLREKGYDTFGTGKWHNGKASFNRSFAAGAEIMFGGMADHWNVPVYHYDPTGAYDKTLPICRNPQDKKFVAQRQADHINNGVHSSEMVCQAGIDYIEKHNGENPFFTYISFLAPHDPRIMPDEFHAMYDPATTKLPPNFCGGHPFDNGATRIRDEELAAFPRNPKETKEHLAEYYAMITHLDYQLGRVMQSLEDKGILEETIIVFAGDNGLALGQHGLFGKQSCYEHSIRVPLIFAGPGVPKGQQRDSYAYLFDIYPTLCELLGFEKPTSVEGKSLKPILDDSKTVLRESLYFAYCQFQRAVKDERFKLIEYRVPDCEPQTQLFDVVNDPWELSNLANQADSEANIKRMRDELFRLRDEWDDREHTMGEEFWGRYEEAST